MKSGDETKIQDFQSRAGVRRRAGIVSMHDLVTTSRSRMRTYCNSALMSAGSQFAGAVCLMRQRLCVRKEVVMTSRRAFSVAVLAVVVVLLFGCEVRTQGMVLIVNLQACIQYIFGLCVFRPR